MSNLSYQRRVAAEIMKCGVNRVKFDPDKLERIASAVTRQDIKNLIHEGSIYKEKVKGTSRARVKKRKRRVGSFKGTFKARFPRKKRWIQKIRALRKMLRNLRDSKKIERRVYRRLYRKLATFQNRKQLRKYLEREGLIKG